MSIFKSSAMHLLLVSAVLSGCASAHPNARRPLPSSMRSVGPASVDDGTVLSFHTGLIDGHWPNDEKDARLLPEGRLAVLTYDGGCPSRPATVKAAGTRRVIGSYVAPQPSESSCAKLLATYTSVVSLPASVLARLPLLVTVQTPGAKPYTELARN